MAMEVPLIFNCGQAVEIDRIEVYNGGDNRVTHLTEVRAVNNNCKTPGFKYSGIGDTFCVDINECETSCLDERYPENSKVSLFRR